jgi:hypothetical protein
MMTGMKSLSDSTGYRESDFMSASWQRPFWLPRSRSNA